MSAEIESVRDALARLRSGEVSMDVIAVLVEAAEAYAAMEPEYGFESPQAGLYYTTRNDMLIETMHAARPDAALLRRLAPAWEATDER